MLYSHTQNEKSFDFFASFLRNAINGDTNYIRLIEPVVSDAQKLVMKEKDYFDINRNSFDVIVFLADKAPQFLEDVDAHHLSQENFHFLLEVITSQQGAVPA